MMAFRLRGARLAWCTIASCASAMLLFGYDQGVMSGLIASDNFKREVFHTPHPSSSISGTVVAIYEIGAFAGAISVMFFGQMLGRKRSTACGQTITIAGAILQATSYSLAQMITARVITGVGVGILTATVPVWAAEIAPAATRGRAGGTLTICAVLGLVISYWTDYGASFHSSSFSFRFPLSLQIVFCILQIATIQFLPESPRWLVARGRTHAAKEVILAICDATTFEDSESAATMLASIEQAVELENDNNPAWRDLFVMGRFQYFRRVLLAFGLQTMQQAAGINVFAYYSTVIFKESIQMDDHLALLMGGFVALSFFCGAFIAIFLVDRVGRRGLMLYGYACTCLGMIIAAVGTSKTTYAYGVAATFGLFFFNFNFGIGLQIPPWLYGVEIMPLKLRYMAGSIVAAAGWIMNYAVVQVTQPGLSSIGYRFFIIFAVFNFICFWIVFWFYPETARKTLEELDFIFMKPEDRPILAGIVAELELEGKGAQATLASHLEDV